MSDGRRLGRARDEPAEAGTLDGEVERGPRCSEGRQEQARSPSDARADLALAQFRVALSREFERYTPITELERLASLR